MLLRMHSLKCLPDLPKLLKTGSRERNQTKSNCFQCFGKPDVRSYKHIKLNQIVLTGLAKTLNETLPSFYFGSV